jgi:hypothetical protein
MSLTPIISIWQYRGNQSETAAHRFVREGPDDMGEDEALDGFEDDGHLENADTDSNNPPGFVAITSFWQHDYRSLQVAMGSMGVRLRYMRGHGHLPMHANRP